MSQSPNPAVEPDLREKPRRPVTSTLAGKVMRASRNLLLSLFLLFSASAWASEFDYRVLIGEWAAFDSKTFGASWYQYLRINDEYEGVFAYSYGKPPAISFRFTRKDIQFIDGVAAIALKRTGWPDWRLVLSAFRSQDGTNGLATGSMFMFQDNNGTPVLFNSPFVRLEPLELNKALQAKPEIGKHREQ